MASYVAPLNEISFVLNNVLNVNRLSQELPNFAEATPDVFAEFIEQAAKFAENELFPLNAKADAEGCRIENGVVHVPQGFKEAFRMYGENGFISLPNPTEYGGLAMPFTLAKVVEELVCSSNVAFGLYPGLTGGCFEAILACASPELKNIYLPKLSSGEWAGTMCITEPQAGSDVGSAKTKAIPQADGSYKIEGGKIFITSGQHEMTDNIVHFVLARIEGAPAGVKGLSTFVVPRRMVNADGSLGAMNALHASNIEHKMGINGSCTCSMSFDGATGWLAGKPNEGIMNMFVMMNLARIMVGYQGLGQCELATQNAIRYALDRKQGRPFSGDPNATIVAHPDVRRMLLQMKATTEGARVLAYETSMYVDISHHHPDPEVREAAQDWVDLNTPLTKAFCTDSAVDLGSMAIQVYGGHGFITEHGIEQILRDSKILCLYEGTNGIQAMDLVRRKLMMHGGRLPKRFFAAVRKELDADTPLGYIIHPLRKALEDLEDCTETIQANFRSNPDDAAFGCCDYQRAFCLVYLGYNWLRMAEAALQAPNADFRAAKAATAQFFATRMLPQVHSLLANARESAADLMAMPVSAFNA